MKFKQNHGEIAWGNYTEQFRSSQQLESVVKALFRPFDGLEKTLESLMTERWLDSAEGQQLDGIGEIVGLKREVSNVAPVKFFGFSEQPNIGTFGEFRLRRNEELVLTKAIALPDEEYRKMLYWKIAMNNSRGTAREIGNCLKIVFDASVVKVKDRGNAKISVWVNRTEKTNPFFFQNPTKWIPKMAGVGVEFLQNDQTLPFGFKEQGFFGFGVGVLAV